MRTDERLEQRAADAAAPPVLHHRHAPDLAVGQHARVADRLAGIVVGDRVQAVLVPLVELDAIGLLFSDEDGEAERRRDRFGLLPGEQLDAH
jgi:hypothetical protein